MEQKKTCETCIRAFVDPRWGDIKCRTHERCCSYEEIKNGCDKWEGKK